jgi:hypothetical protein
MWESKYQGGGERAACEKKKRRGGEEVNEQLVDPVSGTLYRELGRMGWDGDGDGLA